MKAWKNSAMRIPVWCWIGRIRVAAAFAYGGGRVSESAKDVQIRYGGSQQRRFLMKRGRLTERAGVGRDNTVYGPG